MISGPYFADLIAFFVVVTTAQTLHPAGVEIASAADAAKALVPLAGRYAEVLLAIGLVGASLLGATVLPLSTAYLVTEAYGWERGCRARCGKRRSSRASTRPFSWLGALIVIVPGMPLVTLMVGSQFIDGVQLPIILVFIVLLVSSRSPDGAARIGPTAAGHPVGDRDRGARPDERRPPRDVDRGRGCSLAGKETCPCHGGRPARWTSGMMIHRSDWLTGRGELRAVLCRRYGISRKTGYQLAARYARGGAARALHGCARARAAASGARGEPRRAEAAVLGVRARAIRAGGARKLRRVAAAPAAGAARGRRRARSGPCCSGYGLTIGRGAGRLRASPAAPPRQRRPKQPNDRVGERLQGERSSGRATADEMRYRLHSGPITPAGFCCAASYVPAN